MNSLARQALLVCAVVNMMSAANAQQPVQPKFTSAGLKVETNRGEVTEDRRNIVVGLVLTNNNKEILEIIAKNYPELITSGIGQLRGRVSGVAICDVSPPSACRDWLEKGKFYPTEIDSDNSIVVTINFYSNPIPKSSCSADVTMPMVVRSVNGRNPGSWREISVGLPNISLCPKG